MELNDKFEIKSESLGELYVKMKNNNLIYDPYYQRNFVWDEEHQKEFIRTILQGLPCPMIFVAEGAIDLETHIRYLHVIDGQQRMRTVEKFLSNELEVDKKFYRDLKDEEKLNFSSYQIGTVRLKYDPEQDVEEIKIIFQRLNIGNYELTVTEKTLSKFSDNEFIFLSRLISNDKILIDTASDTASDDDDDVLESSKNFRENPFISEDFKNWVSKKDFSTFSEFFLNEEIYSIQQIKRNTNTKDVIDMIGILINEEFHGRTLDDEAIENLTEKVLENKKTIYTKFKKAMSIFKKVEIPEISGFKKRKYFYLRSNAFSLFLAFLINSELIDELDINIFNNLLKDFCNNLPEDFIMAAKNSNMDKKQRVIRHTYIEKLINQSI